MRPSISINASMIEALDDFIDWENVHIFSAIPQDFLDNHLKKLFQKHRSDDEWKDHPCEARILNPDLALTFPKGLV